MTKIRTTISIDENLLQKAKYHKIRISTFLHNILSEYIEKINSQNDLHTAEVSGSNPDKPIHLSNPIETKPIFLQKRIQFFQVVLLLLPNLFLLPRCDQLSKKK